MTIAITGASGQLGRLVADQLLEKVAPGDVVLLTRDPAKLADYAARGASVRAADFGDREGLTAALEGVEKLLLISTDVVGARLEGHLAAIESAAEVGVQHIAYTSVTAPTPDNPALVVPDHAATEEALRESGLQWTMLRNNLYADMQVDAVRQAAASGTFVANTGTAGAAYVTRADCAAVAVGVLTGEGHEGQAYEVTGPHAYTASDLAALAGPEVGVVDVDDEAYAAGLIQAGLPDFLAPLLTSFGTAIREGRLAEVTDVVERIGGRPATALSDLI